jgi:hypothetical protein
MEVSLPLDKMTVAEKLQALELIWADLCSTPDAVPSPAWHASELELRERRAREGASRFMDWDEAKRDIRRATE